MTDFKRYQGLKKSPSIRELFQETHVVPTDFIRPIFINESLTTSRDIASLPGVKQHSLNTVLDEVTQIEKEGVKAILLFGIPEKKSSTATEAYNDNGIVQKAIRLIKENHPNMVVMADCCLCEYTDHGHCGILESGTINNDQTREVLKKITKSYAEAGVDIIAPSGMMDGMVKAIRDTLEEHHYPNILIMSYAAKFASSFYGPFRDAAGSEQFKGDRKHHQINPSQRKEAIQKVLTDIAEGADAIIVKPAGCYTDIIREISDKTNVPIIAYHVSGEYAAIMAADEKGILDAEATFSEVFLSLKRAGATAIITYRKA